METADVALDVARADVARADVGAQSVDVWRSQAVTWRARKRTVGRPDRLHTARRREIFDLGSIQGVKTEQHDMSHQRLRAMRTLLVTATCAANVVISVISTLLYYRELYALKTSPLFATQLNGAMQAAICGILLLALDGSGVAPRKSQPPVAMRRWLELAFWFALQNTLEIASIDGLGPAAGSLAAVLQQAVVPTTLIVSIFLVGRRYSLLHWASALTVVAGVATSFTAGASIPKIPWGWAATLVASRLPQAIANVRTEAALTSAEPAVRQELRSVLRAGFWTALFGLGFNVRRASCSRSPAASRRRACWTTTGPARSASRPTAAATARCPRCSPTLCPVSCSW